MRLHDFNTGVGVCPDNELTDRFGICDNWAVLLSCNPGDIAKHIATMPNWSKQKESIYIVSPEIIKVVIFPHGGELSRLTGDERHDTYQSFNFRALCTFHYMFNDRQKATDILADKRAIVRVSQAITNHARDTNIDLCLPKSIGERYYGSQNKEGKIVYFPDLVEEVMCQ